MKITAIVAGLALVAGLAAEAPADAKEHGHGYGHYKHFQPFRSAGYHGHGYYGPPHGRAYGYGAHRGRLVCRNRYGERRCFRAY